MNKQEAIEAVGVAESATTTDCISVREIKKMDKWDKQDAIKMLKSKMDGSVDTSYEWCETIRMAIQALQDDWIPVSERLPEEAEIVLGTFYYGDDEEYAVHETYLTNAKCLIWGHNPTNEVIAWKPLPKPYMDCEAKIDKEQEHEFFKK